MTARTGARVVTEALGGSALSRAIQDGVLPRGLQPSRPGNAREWTEHVTRARRRDAGWYAALEDAMRPEGAAARRLSRVVAERGVVVTTGQQPGLFGGPVYTIAKALTALAVADAIEEHTGVPATPVFWAATDDADFTEASVAHLADGEGLRELRLTARPPAGTPMSEATLERGELTSLVSQLRKACGSAPESRYVDIASRSFLGEKTLGGAYLEFLRRLLEPLGIPVMDASDASYRAAAQPVLREALARAPEIEQTLAEATNALRLAGFEPQVQDDRGLTLVFEIMNGIKRRLPMSEARGAVQRVLAPNVLLRPVVEREIIPTVAYVGGPGEVAYFVQSNAVARCLNRDPLVVVPRWSCTVVEPFARRALDRLGLDDWRELGELHVVERRLAERALSPDVAESWRTLRSDVQRAFSEFRRGVAPHDLLPDAVLDGLERALQHRLSRGERRLLAAVKRREEGTRRDLATAAAALFPLGKRQERVLNYVPMLARGGDALLEDMRAGAMAHAASLIGVSRQAPVSHK